MILSINKGEKQVEIIGFDQGIRKVEGELTNNNLNYSLNVTVTHSLNYVQIFGSLNQYYRNFSIDILEILDDDNCVLFSTNKYRNLFSENLIHNEENNYLSYTLSFQKELPIEEDVNQEDINQQEE